MTFDQWIGRFATLKPGICEKVELAFAFSDPVSITNGCFQRGCLPVSGLIASKRPMETHPVGHL